MPHRSFLFSFFVAALVTHGSKMQIHNVYRYMRIRLNFQLVSVFPNPVEMFQQALSVMGVRDLTVDC